MLTRRMFLSRNIALGIATGAPGLWVSAASRTLVRTENRRPARITSVCRRDETILRLGGRGDGLTMTWARDDRQFIALQDGIGFGPNWLDMRPKEGAWNSRLLAVRGGPQDAVFETVPGYPELPSLEGPHEQQRYYGFGTLALDGFLYQFLSTLDRPVVFDRPDQPGSHWVGAKLIYSPDNGRTWRNQNGSTPVVWEPWLQRSRQNMTFFSESQDAFSLLTFLQMGRNYEGNRDGYLYVYAPNGNTDGTMNELVMFRVPKSRILDRSAYEYFQSITATGDARWTKDIDARSPVHTFPRGWVNKALPGSLVFESWVPSVVYNTALGLYLMAGSGAGPGPDGSWFGKPSYLGFWTARNPWGPWTQIHEDTAWTPGGDIRSHNGDLQIAPKWIARDGKSFWLVWADFGSSGATADGVAVLPGNPTDPKSTDDEIRIRKLQAEQRASPYYSFNTQRVDLIFS